MNHEIRCPELGCKNPKDFYRNGFYRSRCTTDYYHKYYCKSCKKYFSYRKSRDEYEVPFYKIDRLNFVFDAYCSGETMRRIATNLRKREKKASRETIATYVTFLAKRAKEHHERMINKGKLKTSTFQFDEMETFQNCRVNMITVVISVCARTGRIISLNAAEIKCKGPLANTQAGQSANSHRTDKRHLAFAPALDRMARCAGGNGPITIVTDGKRAYISLLANKFPAPQYTLTHVPVIARNAKKSRTSNNFKMQNSGGVNNPDPMFWLNHLCAVIRADLSRMRRKTWTTTKVLEKLQEHLDLFIAYYNGYNVEDMLSSDGGKMRRRKTMHAKRDFDKLKAKKEAKAKAENEHPDYKGDYEHPSDEYDSDRDLNAIPDHADDFDLDSGDGGGKDG